MCSVSRRDSLGNGCRNVGDSGAIPLWQFLLASPLSHCCWRQYQYICTGNTLQVDLPYSSPTSMLPSRTSARWHSRRCKSPASSFAFKWWTICATKLRNSSITFTSLHEPCLIFCRHCGRRVYLRNLRVDHYNLHLHHHLTELPDVVLVVFSSRVCLCNSDSCADQFRFTRSKQVHSPTIMHNMR